MNCTTIIKAVMKGVVEMKRKIVTINEEKPVFRS
jgi:hypothetical protein